MLIAKFGTAFLFAWLALSCHSDSSSILAESPHSNSVTKARVGHLPESIASLRFTTASSWVVLDEKGNVWLSEDAGNSWRQTAAFVKETQRVDLIFQDKSLGYLLIDDFLRKSSDGGKTWISLNSCRSDETTQTVNAVHFSDQTRGVCVGSTFSSTVGLRGFIRLTIDGGLTWKDGTVVDYDLIAKSKGNRWDLRSVWFVKEKIGWAVGYGVVLKTLDGGKSWTWVRNLEGVFEKVEFSSLQHGWIKEKELSGSLFTNDGGLTWKSVKLPVENDRGGSLLLNRSGRIIFLSTTGAILLSDSSWESWKKVNISNSEWQVRPDETWQGDTYLDRSFSSGVVAVLYNDPIVLSVCSIDEGQTWIACQ